MALAWCDEPVTGDFDGLYQGRQRRDADDGFCEVFVHHCEGMRDSTLDNWSQRPLAPSRISIAPQLHAVHWRQVDQVWTFSLSYVFGFQWPAPPTVQFQIEHPSKGKLRPSTLQLVRAIE